jgi:hypothetical protein
MAYVCFIVDAFSRRIVGWRVAANMKTDIVLDALEMARVSRGARRLVGLVTHSNAGSQGEIKRSSQHLDGEELQHGCRQAPEGDSRVAWRDVVAGSAVDSATRGPGPVLASDRAWSVNRRCRSRSGRGIRGRVQVVPSGWRDVTHLDGSGLGPLLVLRRARGDRDPARPESWGARDRPSCRSRSVDDLTRAAPQRVVPRLLDAVSGATAQWHAERRASRPKVSKLAANDALCAYVQDRLSGQIARPDGEVVPGPEVRFIGRRHGRRADRRWAKAWSPEQISNRLGIDFPDDESMRISHEAIYQARDGQGRGAPKRELVACLRTGRALRVPRARTRGRGKKFIGPEVLISRRPAEVGDRAVPGHWEGDLILGLNSSAIGTLVERTTRFTLLLHLPRMDGHGVQPRPRTDPRSRATAPKSSATRSPRRSPRCPRSSARAIQSRRRVRDRVGWHRDREERQLTLVTSATEAA